MLTNHNLKYYSVTALCMYTEWETVFCLCMLCLCVYIYILIIKVGSQTCEEKK